MTRDFKRCAVALSCRCRPMVSSSCIRAVLLQMQIEGLIYARLAVEGRARGEQETQDLEGLFKTLKGVD